MNFSALIGEGRGIVDVHYNFYQDGSIDIDTVEFNHLDVMPILTDGQLDDIKFQYGKFIESELKELKIDLGQIQYDERLAA